MSEIEEDDLIFELHDIGGRATPKDIAMILAEMTEHWTEFGFEVAVNFDNPAVPKLRVMVPDDVDADTRQVMQRALQHVHDDALAFNRSIAN